MTRSKYPRVTEEALGRIAHYLALEEAELTVKYIEEALEHNYSDCGDVRELLLDAHVHIVDDDLTDAIHAIRLAYKELFEGGTPPEPVFTKIQPTIGETKMTKRRIIQIDLVDNDAGLDVQHSLVASYPNIVSEDDDATTIQELIMTQDVGEKLKAHNEIRAEQVDLDVLKRTGNSVNLQPVKLKDLTWIVS